MQILLNVIFFFFMVNLKKKNMLVELQMATCFLLAPTPLRADVLAETSCNTSESPLPCLFLPQCSEGRIKDRRVNPRQRIFLKCSEKTES